MVRYRLAVVMAGITLLSVDAACANDSIRTPKQLDRNRVRPVSCHASGKNGDIDAAFMSALKTGQFQKARECLNTGANPNQKSEYNKTALMFALQSHRADIELVRTLLKTNDINQRNNYNECAITIACSSGVSPEIVKLLLDSGADKNARCIHGHSLLFIALFSRIEKAAVVKHLLEIGFDPNEKDKNDGYALQLAVKQNKMSSARELVRAGADMSVLSSEERKKLEPHLRYRPSSPR